MKNKIKTFVLNHRSKAVPVRFSNEEYVSKKQEYEAFINGIIQETEQYRLKEKPNLSCTDHPVMIKPANMISMVGDSMGRVFEYEGMILRGIYPGQFDAFKQIYDSGILTVLARHRLIPELTVTDYVTDEFCLVINAEIVSIQESRDWNYAMYRDACILVAELGMILNHFGFTLADGHLNNVTFDHGNPIFVDIGSIISGTETGYRTELLFAGIYHLIFGFIGNSMMYRMLTHDDNNGNIFVFPRSYNLFAREYQMASAALRRYYLFHGSFLQKRIVHNMVENHEYDPWDIELLFPIMRTAEDNPYTCWKELADLIGSHDDIHSVTITGGTSGDLEVQLLKQYPKLSLIAADYREHRLSLAYQQMKPLKGNHTDRLYNYLYLVPSAMELLKSDFAFYADPLNDSPAFWPVNDHVLANAVIRLADKYIGILYPFDSADRYKQFIEQYLLYDAELIQIKEFVSDRLCFASLQIKASKEQE